MLQHMDTTISTSLKKPASVVAAFCIWLLLSIGSIGFGIAAFAMSDTLVASATSAGLGPDGLRLSAAGLIAIGVVQLIVALLMLRGASWARVALLVVALISQSFSFATNPTNGAGWITLVISALSVILMFTPAAERYFARPAYARQ